MPKSKEEKVITITVRLTATKIDVTFSDWLKLNPAKLSRVGELIHKAWRKERAIFVHKDRVAKAEAAKKDADHLANIVNSEEAPI